MDSAGDVMRQKMDKTLAGLNDKLGALERQVLGTVRTVKDSVNTVRDTFDVKLQVRRRPWVLLAGAAALGFFGGFRSGSRGTGHTAQNGYNDGTLPARAASIGAPCVDAARISPADTPVWRVRWGSRFQPEISALRGVAMGALLELAREFITKPAARPPEQTTAKASRNSKGRPGMHTVPRRPPAARRRTSSQLHPLEDVTDGKTDRRPR